MLWGVKDIMKYRSLPVTHYQQNCSIVWCEQTKKAAVIDPGGDLERIVAEIRTLAVMPEKILLTHGHMDHVGATSALSQMFSLPIEGPHREDQFWLDALDTQAQMMGFSPVSGFLPTRWLDDGDVVSFGQCELTVYHCPGHTPGHVVFYHADSQRAFVGDVIFQGSIGRTDFPRGNHEQLLSSIREKLFPLGDAVVFVPGHGPESNFGHERQHNPFVADTRFG